MIQKKTIKLFGVAGAGKTTKCLEYINDFLKEGYIIEDICFTTFTKAGIKSMVDKLHENGIIFNQKNTNIRTMNSLTWRLAGFNDTHKLSKNEIDLFFESIKIKIEKEEEENKSESDIVLSIYDRVLNAEANFIRNLDDNILKKHIYSFFDEYNITTFDIETCLYGLISYDTWKEKNGKKTFVDSIIYCIEKKIDIPNKILFVDEAQDLSFAFSKLVDLWSKYFDRDYFVIAGDDDQTVHEWNGATPQYLVEYDNTNLVVEKLEKSYRCPSNICVFADNILKDIHYREPKSIFSNNDDGLFIYTDLTESGILNFFDRYKDKSCFFLFRTNKIKDQICDFLFSNSDIPFGKLSKDEDNKHWTSKLMKISNALNKINNKQDILKEELEKLLEVLPSRECLKRGVKVKYNKLPAGSLIKCVDFLNDTERWNSQRSLTSFNLKEDIGNNIKQRILGHVKYIKGEDLKSITKNEVYIKKLLSIDNIFKSSFDENNKLLFEHNLNFGTFHSSKGLESDYVFVFLGTSFFFRNITDSEKRCFYVACTRAKKGLLLIGCSNLTINTDTSLEDYYQNMILNFYRGNNN